MRIVTVNVRAGTTAVAAEHPAQWDSGVRLNVRSDEEMFTSATELHVSKGFYTETVPAVFVSAGELYADLPDWLWESGESAAVELYQSGTTIAEVLIPVTGRPVLPEPYDYAGLVYRPFEVSVLHGVASLEIPVKQLDKGSRSFRFRFWHGARVLHLPEGAQVSLSIQKPDGFLVVQSCAVEGDFVYVTLNQQACAVKGRAVGELTISHNGAELGSANITFVLQMSPKASGVVSDSSIAVIEEQLEASAANAETAQAAAASAGGSAAVAAERAEAAAAAQATAERASGIAVEKADAASADVERADQILTDAQTIIAEASAAAEAAEAAATKASAAAEVPWSVVNGKVCITYMVEDDE